MFNSRKDREHRIVLFRNVLSHVGDLVNDVLIIGDYPKKVAFYVGHGAVPCSAKEVFGKVSSSSGAVFVGLGNIKGAGEELIGMLQSLDSDCGGRNASCGNGRLDGCDGDGRDDDGRDGCDGKGAV